MPWRFLSRDRLGWALAGFALVLGAGVASAQTTAPGCDPADVCCSQCGSEAIASCPNDMPFLSYDDFAAQRDEWLAELAANGCGAVPFGVYGFVEGDCFGTDRRFLHLRKLVRSEAHVFDDAGDFLGSGIGSDVVHPVCGLETYYPERTACTAVVDTIHCGAWWGTFAPGPLEIGDSVTLPGGFATLTVPAVAWGSRLLLVLGLSVSGVFAWWKPHHASPEDPSEPR